MQDYSSFNAKDNMGLNLENRFRRLAVHCATSPHTQTHLFHKTLPTVEGITKKRIDK